MTSALFHPQYKQKKMAALCSGCVFTVCVLTAVCAHLDGLHAEHKFRIWDTTCLHVTSFPLYSIQLYLNEQECELFTQARCVQ